MTAPPLAGLKILEIGHYIAAPFCTQILADLGRGDQAGAAGRRPVPRLGRGERWQLRLVQHPWPQQALDRTGPEEGPRNPAEARRARRRAGGEPARRPVGAAEIGPDVLHAVEPAAGDRADFRLRPGRPVSRQAGFRRHRGGYRRAAPSDGPSRRHDGLPPPRCGISISDDLAGLYAAIGLLAAVWQRDAMGDRAGRVVDVNLVDSVFSLMEGMLPEYALDGRVRQPAGAALPTASPTNTYPCADGSGFASPATRI